MEKINQIFNNRELAIFTLISIFLLLSLLKKTIRESIKKLLKAFFNFKIQATLFSMFLYTTFITVVLNYLNFWNYSMLKDTIYWAIGVGFISLVNIDKIKKSDNYLKSIILENFKVIILFEFLVNLYFFSYLTELIIIPIIALTYTMSVFTEEKEEYKTLRNLLNNLLTLYGLLLVCFSIYKLVESSNNIFSLENLKSIMFSPLYSVLYIPFIYTIALYNSYELLFLRLNWNLEGDNETIRWTKRKIYSLCKFNLTKVELISKKINVYKGEEKEEIINDLKQILK